LINKSRGLVADATIFITIEKPVLLQFQPEVGLTTEAERKRFSRWVAQRLHRPAFPDAVVATILKPILENLREMQKNETLDVSLMNRISEIRLFVNNDSIPFHFDLLFMIDEDESISAVEIELAPMIGEMRKWFLPSSANLRNWFARSYNDISVTDYLAHEKISLDEYSYNGTTVQGLLSPDTAF
jgi:hypothetical protein